MNGVDAADADRRANTDDTELAAPTLGDLLRPHAGGFAVVVVLQLLSALLGLAPLLAVVELGRVLLAPGGVDETRAWIAVGVGLAGMLARLGLAAAAAGSAHVLDGRVALSLRRLLAAQLGRAPIGWLSQRRTGELSKVVGADVSAVHPLIAHAPGELISAFAIPVVSLSYLVAIDWRLTLVTLAPVLVAVSLAPLMMTPSRTLEQKEFDAAMGRISNAALEFVQGIAVVKTFGASGRAHGRFIDAVDDFVGTFGRWVRGISGIAAAMQLALSPPVVLLAILVGGTALVADGSIPPPDLLPFLFLGPGLAAPVAALGHGFDDIQAARRALDRIRAVLAVSPLPPPRRPLRPLDHRLEIHGVHFAYDSGPDVLCGVDLALEPGTTTALVGRSGSGKSTLIQLLPRFFDPTRGSISLGGVDLRDLDPSDLHAAVAFVFQDVRLLHDSVASNIALAVPHADPADVERAARQANIHERIVVLPRGYASVIGDDATLSGGETQRIALARAFLANAAILVLDEATAFADPQTELAVRRALRESPKGQTKLIVAHRLETIMEADTVIVLDGGRIVERGDPSDLLARGGAFTALWQAQNGTVPSRPEVESNVAHQSEGATP